jgi:hypothetical protein
MNLKYYVAVVTVLLGVVGVRAPVLAQATDTFTARLGWVPSTPRERPGVTGKGSATGTLTGNRLSVTGSFEGLPAPATVARLHRGMATGARGPAISDLVITQAVSGTISGTVTLSSTQVEDLKRGRLYLQVHSEKGVEDGSTLWGWFLP